MSARDGHRPSRHIACRTPPRAAPPGFALAQFAKVALALIAMLAFGLPKAAGQEPAAPAPHAVLLDVQGPIGPAVTNYLRQGFDAAEERGAELIILRMDTPGGLSSATRDIVQDILASPVPVAGYVAPGGARAASAGTYILYASHLAAMAPGTNLGAATPVRLGGSGPSGAEGSEETDPSEAKAVNDAVAYIRGLAELRGRNADWAEQAVREAASLPAREALSEQVIDMVVVDVQDLLARADGRSVEIGGERLGLDTAGLEVFHIEPDWRTRLLALITNPNIAYILMLIGIYGIIFELMSPGTIFPGLVGAIALMTALFALNLLPINYVGAGLILLGIALMTTEAFLPSFGALGIGGAVAFSVGSLFMFEEVPGFELSLPVIVTATALSATLLMIVIASVVRAHRRKVVTGEQEMIGALGEVLAWAGESGQVRVHSERWQARSSRPLKAGEQVRVIARDKLTLVVEPAASPPLP